MKLIKVRPTGNRYPYLTEEFRKENPHKTYARNISEQEFNDFDVYIVKETTKPQHDKDLQNAIEIDPILVDGVWTQQWTIQDKTNEEIRQTLIEKENRRYEKEIEQGWKVTGRDYSLKCKECDIAKFHQRLSLMQRLIESGAATTETTDKIKDANDNKHEETLGFMLDILLEYGVYVNNIWNIHTDNLQAIMDEYHLQSEEEDLTEELNSVEVTPHD